MQQFVTLRIAMPTDKFEHEIPNLVLEKDDLHSHRRDRTVGKPSSSKPDATPEPVVQVKSGGGTFLGVIALLVALGACGGGYWLFQQGELARQDLSKANNRISELERMLSATDAEMGQSTVALQAKVGQLSEKTEELWTQMDKLWASAWRRNQEEIQQLGTQLKSSGDQTNKKFTVLESDLALGNANLEAVKERLESQQQTDSELSKAIQTLDKTGAERAKAMAALQKRLDNLALDNQALARRIAELEKAGRAVPSVGQAPSVGGMPSN
ncbi:hypothetical protein P2G88_01655 [Aliiglaciecola sp. CAU 1673]|uniref:hypothetical protein n=1 Tax=Aliiglaciecola sp. CAU 1673 TaxID=3032595 RepID=UPI0023DCE8A2|nr:hypothetical protein [Aliiglaciecola sp. CAU 1673]MDF2176958.1 hypothetical protein [Aliiglaciecola sp. CAU 1673]